MPVATSARIRRRGRHRRHFLAIRVSADDDLGVLHGARLLDERRAMTTSPLILSSRDERIVLPTFRVTRTWRPAGLRLPSHSHECTNVALCVSGRFDELVGSRWQRVTPATLIIRPGAEAHANDYSQGHSRAIVIELSQSTVEVLSRTTSVIRSACCIESAAIVARVQRLNAEMAHPDDLSGLAIEAVLYELLVLASRETTVAEDQPQWMSRVVEFLNANLGRRLFMADLEELAGVGSAHLAKTFRARHGVTIAEYMRRQRIALAAQLLRDPRISLADIAAKCGFCDQSHFSRAFKRQTGASPLRFRRQLL